MLPTPRRLTVEEKCIPWKKKNHDMITRRRNNRGWLAGRNNRYLLHLIKILLNYFSLYLLKWGMSNFRFLRYKAWDRELYIMWVSIATGFKVIMYISFKLTISEYPEEKKNYLLKYHHIFIIWKNAGLKSVISRNFYNKRHC